MNTATPPRTAEDCAQAQLDAYNNRDISTFAEVYHEDVVLRDLRTGVPFCTGRSELIERYGKQFSDRPLLHCTLVSRVVCPPFVFDEELVAGLVEGQTVHAVATYEVSNGYILQAWFAREDQSR